MTELERELLAALKVMLHRTGHWFDESSGDLQQALAAIAKAEGRHD